MECERTELVVESARVSLVVEEEESNAEGPAGRAEQITPGQTGEWDGKHLTSVLPGRRKLGAPLALAFLLSAVIAAAYFSSLGGTGQAIESLAVLPFANTGGAPDMEFLSDGITDNLINRLSRLPNLKVMSRNSVFHYKACSRVSRTVRK